MKYLVQDGNSIKKVTMDGLETTRNGLPNIDDFEKHGTYDLADIIGESYKETNMIYMDDLDSQQLYRYRFTGYKDIMYIGTNEVDGEIYLNGTNNNNTPLVVSSLNVAIVQFNPDKIDLIARSRNDSVIVTQNKVDLSKVNKITIDAAYTRNNYGYGGMIISVNEILNSSRSVGVRHVSINTSGRSMRTIDVSDLEGEFFIKVVVCHNNGQGADPRASIYSMLLVDENNEIIKPSPKLVRSNSKYYTCKNNNFVELEATKENFDMYNINLSDLLMQNEQGIKLLMTLEDPEIVCLSNSNNFKLHIKGFKDMRPFMESENPKLLIYSESGIPTVEVTAAPEAQIVKPNDDIKLKMLDKVNSITLISNELDSGDVRIVFSIDSGLTWKTYNTISLSFEDININNLESIKVKGMDTDTFNTIGEKWNDVITESKIRFAYYLEIDDTTDKAEVDKLSINMDLTGKWKKAIHVTDYDYEYDNEHIYVTFKVNGSYKVNYAE